MTLVDADCSEGAWHVLEATFLGVSLDTRNRCAMLRRCGACSGVTVCAMGTVRRWLCAKKHRLTVWGEVSEKAEGSGGFKDWGKISIGH